MNTNIIESYTNTINNDDKKISEEDKDYLISASKVVESVFDNAKMEQHLGLMTEEKRNNIMIAVNKLMIPPSIRNTKAEDLREIIVDKYIEESVAVMREKAGKKQRSCIFDINKEDEDLVEKLTIKWHSRCVGVVVLPKTETEIINIKLSW